MEPKLLFKDDFETITSGMEKKAYESFSNGKLKCTFLEARPEQNKSLWFIELKITSATYYLWVDKKYFDKLKKLFNKDETRKESCLKELRKAIFFNPDSLS